MTGGPAVSERFDGCGVGADRTAHSAGQARRSTRTVDVRAVLQGVLYVLETGCQWRHLPKDFPPRSTVWEYFDLWRYDGTLDRIHETLYVALREKEGSGRLANRGDPRQPDGEVG
jgi:transposase